ncbi:MAG: hypothetical protein IPH72_15980 [Sandaracinaceae bacterium]|nr:hypothetical protein [Sandaracinaceae bacterium]
MTRALPPPALRLGAHAICEKPLVINPWNLDQPSVIEGESNRAYTVLQLRLASLIVVKARSHTEDAARGIRHQVLPSYATCCGRWYDVSWKGDEAKSGGLVTNIGIHRWTSAVWLFAPREARRPSERDRVSGFAFEHADVRWLPSTRT